MPPTTVAEGLLHTPIGKWRSTICSDVVEDQTLKLMCQQAYPSVLLTATKMLSVRADICDEGRAGGHQAGRRNGNKGSCVYVVYC